MNGFDVLLRRLVGWINLQRGSKLGERLIEPFLLRKHQTEIQVRPGKVWTITDGLRKLRSRFLEFSLGRQFNPEQVVCLPEFRFELNGDAKRFNRPGP